MISPDLVARAVTQIRKSAANYEYFFESLSSPEWLEPLRDAGFFAAPPPPVHEGKYVSFPGWPESRYLARMAAIESAAQVVYLIASKIPPTENVRVYHDLAEIALSLPPDLGARFVSAAKAWIASPYQLLIPEQVGKLVHRLAEHGKTRAALDLSKTLLELVPESQEHEGAEDRREVRAHFDVWHYKKILDEHIPALVQAAGEAALSTMCDLLASAVALSTRKRSPDDWEDYSWIWHPAIEDHSQNTGRRAKDALLAGVRDAAEQVLRGNLAVLPRVAAELESRRWTVFRRIALHLLATFPEASGSFAEAKLTDRKLFDDISVHHEYYRLAHAAFASLPQTAQETLLSFIEQGPDMQQAARWLTDGLRREPTEDELVRYQRVWQLKHLIAVKHALPPALVGFELRLAGSASRPLESASMDPAGIPALREAIRHMHGVDAVFVEWVETHETFQGQTAWEREVGVFRLVGHPKADRAYAWSEPGTGTARRFFAVLHVPPITGPVTAVRASIVADARKK